MSLTERLAAARRDRPEGRTRGRLAAGRTMTPEDRYRRIRRRLDLAGNPAGWDADRVVASGVIAAITGAVTGAAVPAAAGSPGPTVAGLGLASGVVGWPMEAGLALLADRTDVAGLRSFVGDMVQAEALGIATADVLRVQARELRVNRSQRTEEKAQKVPVKIVFPLILCIVPPLFVVVIGPAMTGIMSTLTGR